MKDQKGVLMKIKNMPPLKIGNLTAKIPIIQGGMGIGISGSKLASAVANEGGIGVIAAVGLGMLKPKKNSTVKESNRHALKKEIQKTRALTDGLLGVNIMVALSDYDELMECAIEENVDILFLGAGLPIRFSEKIPPERLQKLQTKLIPIISSAKAAKTILNFWDRKYHRIPDAFVIEGPMAGGHLGFKLEQIDDPEFALERLIPQISESIKPFEEKYKTNLPLIAAGGVFTGKDIHQMFELGAQGVQMGTRFVATHECDASIQFKDMYVNAKQGDLTIIKSPVGLPGRALTNDFLQDVSAGIKKPFSCPWKCLHTCKFPETPYCIAAALMQARNGKLSHGFAFAGSNAWKIKEIISVNQLIETLCKEYDEVAGKQTIVNESKC